MSSFSCAGSTSYIFVYTVHTYIHTYIQKKKTYILLYTILIHTILIHKIPLSMSLIIHTAWHVLVDAGHPVRRITDLHERNMSAYASSEDIPQSYTHVHTYIIPRLYAYDELKMFVEYLCGSLVTPHLTLQRNEHGKVSNKAHFDMLGEQSRHTYLCIHHSFIQYSFIT